MKQLPKPQQSLRLQCLSMCVGSQPRISLWLISLLLVLMFLPSSVLAQSIQITDYDKSATFTMLKENYTPISASENSANLFDGKKTQDNFSKWCGKFTGEPVSVIFEASRASYPLGYTITVGNDNSLYKGRNPLSWRLYANNEGADGEWKLIHEVTNDATLKDVDYSSAEFNIPAAESFKYYKWEITAIHSGQVFQVGEFELKLSTCSHTNADGTSALGAPSSSVSATCTSYPYSICTCSLCNTLVRQITRYEYAPHTPVLHSAVEPTCTEAGSTEYYQCSSCQKLFSDDKAEHEITDANSVVVPAKGHSYNGKGVCQVCGKSEPRISQIVMDGIDIESLTDNSDNVWAALDLTASELTAANIPADSKGLMSDPNTSSVTVQLKSDHPYVLSFSYGLSAETIGYFNLYLDGSQVSQVYDNRVRDYSVVLRSGSHKLTFEYTKYRTTTPRARAFIYNMQASTSYSGPAAEYDAASKTLTLKTVSDATLTDNLFAIGDVTTIASATDKSDEVENIVIDESFKTFAPTTLYGYFRNLKSLKTITGLGNINTTNVSDIQYMFDSCEKLTDLDIDKLNTENVIYMSGLFDGCWLIESLDLSNFNTDNVTQMNRMFNFCQHLKSIKFGDHFNTSNVEYMAEMFSGCYALESLDLSGFNTLKVTAMDLMFCNCYSLKSVKFSDQFITANVQDMSYMFKNCYSLEQLDLSTFATSKVNTMSYMFQMDTTQPNKLKSIYVGETFSTRQLTYGQDMFKGCTNLPNFNSAEVDQTHANYKSGGYFLKLVATNGDDCVGASGDDYFVIDNITFADDKDFHLRDYFRASTAAYSRSVSSSSAWATLCLPFDVDMTKQNFRAFNLLSVADDKIELEEITTTITAGTPVVIKMNNGETSLNISEHNKDIIYSPLAPSAVDGYQLVGLFTTKMFSKDTDNNCYILKGDKLMNPAKMLENVSTKSVGSKPFRAYMKDNNQSEVGAKMFSISIGSETTAIDGVGATDNTATEYYDLQGNLLSQPQKGINIVKRAGKTMKLIIK